MSRKLAASILAVTGLVLLGLAHAQSAGYPAQSQSPAAPGSAFAGAVTETNGSSVPVPAPAATPTPPPASTEGELAAIRDKGAKASPKARAETERKLESSAKSIDAEAVRLGEVLLAGRLSGEFGPSIEALTAEKIDLKISWGELVIAHTLVGNTKAAVGMVQLAQLHSGGMGWGQIAAGLGLDLHEVVSAVHTESRVATGQSKGDGKVATIHGEGSRAGARAPALQAGVGLAPDLSKNR
jgi:hypothetical protein